MNYLYSTYYSILCHLNKDCKPNDYKKIRVCEKDKDVPHCPTRGHATWDRWMSWSECEGQCGETGVQI